MSDRETIANIDHATPEELALLARIETEVGLIACRVADDEKRLDFDDAWVVVLGEDKTGIMMLPRGDQWGVAVLVGRAYAEACLAKNRQKWAEAGNTLFEHSELRHFQQFRRDRAGMALN